MWSPPMYRAGLFSAVTVTGPLGTFSAPNARAMSNTPDVIPQYACQNAVEPLEHAFSTLMIGTPVRPSCASVVSPIDMPW